MTTITLNFDSLPSMDYRNTGAPIPVAAQLSTQYLDTYGVSFTSASQYVAVVNLGVGHATSGTNGIGGSTPASTLDYAEPVIATFFDPSHPTSAGITDFVSIRSDQAGNSVTGITLNAYDVNHQLIATATVSDIGGALLSVAVPGIHSVEFLGNYSVAWDDFTFHSVTAADTTAPTSAITTTLLNDTGVSHTDLITSDGHVTVTGTASEQVSGVEIWNAVTDTQVGTANIALDGESWTFSGNLVEGSYQLYAQLMDLAGNVGQTDTQPTIVVDQTKPVPVMLDAVYHSATNLTTLSGTSEANSSVSVFDGTKPVGTTTAAADGTWSLNANVTGNTVHSYTEKSTDLAGNTGSSAGVTLYTQQVKSLQGSSGNDVLIGGPNDKLTGGGGTNTFVFNPNFGKETITDLGWANPSNHNVIAFDKTLFANPNPTASQVFNQAHDSKAGAVIVIDAHDTVTLTGVSVAQLQSHLSDIHFF